jgi:type II secretory pathway pseudopilin PulG
MTLMEIIIVIAIVGLVYATVVPQFNILTGVDRAEKLARLGSDIRAAFDMSVLNNRPFRLVFDLKAGEYWLEGTERRDFWLSETDRDYSGEEYKEFLAIFEEEFEQYQSLMPPPIKDAESDKEIAVSSPVIEAKDALAPVQWSPIENMEFSKRSIGPEMFFPGIWCEHHQAKIQFEMESAIAAMYFFPGGYVEKCVIHVAFWAGGGLDPTAEPYTLTTRPYEGIVDMQNGMEEISPVSR